MSRRKTSKGTSSVTSSPAKQVGRARLDSSGGRKTAKSGQAVVHANHSRQPESIKARKTKGISGRSSSALSPSASLQSVLASKLYLLLGEIGSPECVLTWKNWDMKSGPPICALRARKRPEKRTSRNSGKMKKEKKIGIRLFQFDSPHPISASGLSGWQTPTVNDSKASDYSYIKGKGGKRVKFLKLPGQAKLASWPTPCTPSGGRSMSIKKMDATGKTIDGKKHTASLEHAVRFALPLASWPTPDAQAMNVGADLKKHMERLVRLKKKHGNGNGAGLTLGIAAQLVNWPTPNATDGSKAPKTFARGNLSLPSTAKLPFGQPSTSSPAPTKGRGALNPSHSAWLMGYPKEWLLCGLLAVRRLVKAKKARRAKKP